MLKFVNNPAIIFILLFTSCVHDVSVKENLEARIKNKTIYSQDSIEYKRVFRLISDSIETWKLNSLPGFQEKIGESEYYVDSLLCMNKSKNRLVTCLLSYNITKINPTGGISFFYGEKINNEWYFFTGDHIFIPTEMKKAKTNEPFTYLDLHEIALNEVYKGYLKPEGGVNDEWFTKQFENIGWGDFQKQEFNDWCFNGKRYNNPLDFYQASHLCKVRGNWQGRDTTKAIIQLQPSL